jgi:hypothetical protein
LAVLSQAIGKADAFRRASARICSMQCFILLFTHDEPSDTRFT